MISFLDAIWRESMMTDKLYGYFIDNALTKISSSKELLQEILMDDYYEEAYYWYNYLTSFFAVDQLYEIYEISSPHDFWHKAKDKNFFNFINSHLSSRVIEDLEEYRVE